MNRKIFIAVAAAVVLLAGGFGARKLWVSRAPESDAAKMAGFHCPMHPAYHSDKPGSCPICSMTLVPDDAEPEPAGAAKAAAVSSGKILYYRSPMNPQQTSPTPHKDEMGMDYVPVYAEEAAPSPVPGQGTVSISEERRQQIGMTSAPVRYREMGVVVRATGQVAYDPDLYHAINEYGEAVKAREAVQNSPYPDVHQRADALVQASDLRLRQMGLSQTQITEIARSTQPPTNLLFGSPGGTVWVYAQVYEYEIHLVKPGQQVEIAAPAYPGRRFQGTVKSLDPILSAETRALRARIEVPNPEGLLALQMYVDARIRTGLGRRLALPTGALVDTGTRKIVFIDLGNGRIEPREVEVGHQAEGYYEVLAGLKEGETVVTSANFLIDSESKLKAIAPVSVEKANPQQEHRH